MLDFLGDVLSPEEESREERVLVRDFDKWLKEEVRKSEEISWEGASSRYRAVEDVLEEIRGNLKNLKQKEIPDEVESRLKKAGESNKEALVGRLEGFLDNFQFPEGGGFEGAVRFIQKKSEELDNLSDKLQSNFMFLQKVQREESQNLLNSIKKLDRKLETGANIDKIQEIKEAYSQLVSDLEKLEEIDEEIKRMKDELDGKEGTEDELQGKLEKVREREETQEIKEKKEKINELGDRRKKIKNRILQKISPLKRGLKKLNYFGTVEKEDLLEEYIDSPFDAAKGDEDLSSLQEILNKLKNSLKEESLNFSGKERGKVERDLNRIDIGGLVDLKEEWLSLGERVEELESQIRELKTEGKRKELESKLENEKKEAEKLTERIDRKVKRREEVKEGVKDRKKNLEKMVHDLLGIKLDLVREDV